MNRRLLAFRVFPVVIVVLMVVAGKLVGTPLGEAIKLFAEALCPAAAYVGMRIFGAMQRRAWWLLLLGQATWLVPSVFYSYNKLTGRTPAIGLAGHQLHATTVFVMLGYVFFALALLAIGRTIEPEHRGSSTVDAWLIVLGLGAIALTLVTWPAVHSTTLSFNDRVEAIYVPFADIAMVAAGARSFTAPGQRGLSIRMLLIGSCMVACSDIVEQFGWVHGWDNGLLNTVNTSAFYAALVMIAMAPLHPSMRDLRTIPTRQNRMHVARIGLLTIALLAPWLVLLGQVTTGTGPIAWTIAVAAVQSGLAITRMRGLMTDLHQHAAALHRAARTDHLTQLSNRRHLEEVLAELAAGHRNVVSMALLDLDHFKRVNDQQGHQAGDALLRHCAAVWSAVLDAHQNPATLARMGGEEFLLILPGVGAEVAEPIVAKLRANMPAGQSFSAGLSLWRTDDDPREALGAADAALYEAKNSGRGRTVVAGAAGGPALLPVALPTA